MVKDYRKDPMDSAEGLGNAKRLWTGWSEALGFERPPVWDRAFTRLGEKITMEAMGFWMCWHLFGGFDGMRQAGWSRATIYRHLKRFRNEMGKHPDELRFPGVEIRPGAFWDAHLLPEVEAEG